MASEPISVGSSMLPFMSLTWYSTSSNFDQLINSTIYMSPWLINLKSNLTIFGYRLKRSSKKLMEHGVRISTTLVFISFVSNAIWNCSSLMTTRRYFCEQDCAFFGNWRICTQFLFWLQYCSPKSNCSGTLYHLYDTSSIVVHFMWRTKNIRTLYSMHDGWRYLFDEAVNFMLLNSPIEMF